MRRLNPIHLVAGLAVAAALALPAASLATHTGHVFQADVTLLGKAKAGKPTPAAMHILLRGADDPATPNDPAPPKAQVIRILVDKAINVSTKGLTPCTANLENTTPELALEACPKSQVGTGDVTAAIGGVPVVGTALFFVGPNSTLIVHIRVPALSVTQIIPGAIQQASDQSLYGQELVFNVPSLAGGAGSLTSLEANLQKVEKKKKKKSGGASASKKKKKKKKEYSLFSAQCTDGEWNFRNDETYSDHEPISETVTQTCTK
jgi:hypothetical protein